MRIWKFPLEVADQQNVKMLKNTTQSKEKIMGWNHRIVLFPDCQTFKVMEVYYDDQRLPWGCNNAAAIHTEHDNDSTPQESIREQLEEMIQATYEPVLNMATDFTGEAPKPEGGTINLSEPGAIERFCTEIEVSRE